MGLLDRYLLRQLLGGFVFVLLAVIVVVLFTQSFRFLSLVIESAATLKAFLWLMLISVPTFLHIIAPVAFVIAVLFTYQRLMADRELVIMRSAGRSPLQLAAPALWLAVVVTLMMLAQSLVWAPWANRVLVDEQYAIKNNFTSLLLRPGTFNDLLPGLTFYARKRDSEGAMEGILIHDFRNKEKPTTIMAERGLLQAVNGETPKVIVFNGLRQEFNRHNKKLNELTFSNYTMSLEMLKNRKVDRVRDLRELPLVDLLMPRAASIEKTGRNNSELGNELQLRLATPLLSISFASIALVVLLTGDYSRRGMQKRMGIAVGLIIAVQAAFLWLTNLLEVSGLFILPLYGVLLLPLVLCLWRLGVLSSWAVLFPFLHPVSGATR